MNGPEYAVRQGATSIGSPERLELCELELAAGRFARCGGSSCPFWEDGGAALPPGCALGRLGLDLSSRLELVSALRDIRSRLEVADDREEAWSLFYRLSGAPS